MSVVPIADARDGFSKLLAEVENTHERVTITRHGRAIAVVMSPEDLAALEETADVMSTPGAADAIAEGVAELDAGQEIDGPEVLAQFRVAEPYSYSFAPRAVRDLGKLPEAVAAACAEFIAGSLRENPQRCGEPLLRGPWVGLWSARRGTYRIIYRLDDRRRRLQVVHIDHRSRVYH